MMVTQVWNVILLGANGDDEIRSAKMWLGWNWGNHGFYTRHRSLSMPRRRVKSGIYSSPGPLNASVTRRRAQSVPRRRVNSGFICHRADHTYTHTYTRPWGRAYVWFPRRRAQCMPEGQVNLKFTRRRAIPSAANTSPSARWKLC